MRPLRIELEVEREGDPIAGRLAYEDGESVSFTGWLELMAAIEVALAQGSRTDTLDASDDKGVAQ